MTGDGQSEPEGTVDLSTCDREPIHIPGRIQSFGALIAVSSDWIVSHASRNTEHFLGVTANDLIGKPLSDAVEAEALRAIRNKLQTLTGADSVERLFGVRVRQGQPLLDIALHRSGGSMVFEFERHGGSDLDDYVAHIRPMMVRMSQTETIEDLCGSATRQLKALTGFDRVMLYKFAKDGSGSVIAEERKIGMEPFEGLHFPATDIPEQARLLYTRNLLRIISDVEDEGVPIEPPTAPGGEPLDLSLSATRAVSPIHIEYLKNMGVRASMSVSIVKRGRLWGLFACHHEAPRTLSYDVRTAVELFGQLFSFVLDQKESEREREIFAEAQALHDDLMARLAEGASLEENFQTIAEAIGTVIPHDGAAAWIEGRFQALGDAPTRQEFLDLVRFLNTGAASRVYHTTSIKESFAGAAAFADKAAGLLALPVSRMSRDYIVLFRKELRRSVVWAGNPDKPVEAGPNGDRLTPRKSFEAWQQTVKGRCSPWTETEIRTAEALRVTLVEVVLRMLDAAMQDQAKAQERQELLIAELNHRVRNILNLIRSLVNQSQAEAKTAAEFTDVIGGRINALARAHDQITKESWAPSSFKDMVRTEIEAYLGQKKSDRLVLTGPDVLLTPGAFTTMALVVHELLTNAVKYGALRTGAGRIDLSLTPQEDGHAEVVWRESGGPPISAQPSRRGFGTTIIERSVPFELHGEAQLRFETSGLSARFVLPAVHVAGIAEDDVSDPEIPVPPEPAPGAALSGDVLVVEDNMIIALDAEHFLYQLGAARVHVASGTQEALEIACKTDLEFALLDVNLGMETSEPVARHLREKGVPFVFATGYGDTAELGPLYEDTGVILKPYDRTRVEEAILAGRGAV